MKKSEHIRLPSTLDVLEFLDESNAIEGVYGKEALKDAKKAWDYLIKKDHVTTREIFHVHGLLMKKLNPRIAGKLRECDVWIGGQHKKFVGADILLYQIRNVLMTVEESLTSSGSGAETAKICHVAFEDVHPFEDGNGRVGRILYNWHRLKLGLPLHIIHEGSEQMEYYGWFKKSNGKT